MKTIGDCLRWRCGFRMFLDQQRQNLLTAGSTGKFALAWHFNLCFNNTLRFYLIPFSFQNQNSALVNTVLLQNKHFYFTLKAWFKIVKALTWYQMKEKKGNIEKSWDGEMQWHFQLLFHCGEIPLMLVSLHLPLFYFFPMYWYICSLTTLLSCLSRTRASRKYKC